MWKNLKILLPFTGCEVSGSFCLNGQSLCEPIDIGENFRYFIDSVKSMLED